MSVPYCWKFEHSLNVLEYTFLDDTRKTKPSDRDVFKKILARGEAECKNFLKTSRSEGFVPGRVQEVFSCMFFFCCLRLLELGT